MTDKFEPKNLKEAWLYAWTILQHLNNSLGTPYTIRRFGPGGAPLQGVEDPGFEVRAIDLTNESDPLSLILVQEAEGGYSYQAMACLDPTAKDNLWMQHELADPADAVAFGMSGIVDVRFQQAAHEAAAGVRVVRPGDPGADVILAEVLGQLGGGVRH